MNNCQEFSAEGGCACGAVRYQIVRVPLFVHCCHCYECQRATGTAFALNAMLETQHIHSLATPPKAIDIPTQSGKGQRTMRCPKCQVTVWSHYATAGEAIGFIRVGTLDKPQCILPDIHIYTDSKQPWVVLPEGIPAMKAYYDPRKYWPESSLQRWRALSA